MLVSKQTSQQYFPNNVKKAFFFAKKTLLLKRSQKYFLEDCPKKAFLRLQFSKRTNILVLHRGHHFILVPQVTFPKKILQKQKKKNEYSTSVLGCFGLKRNKNKYCMIR